MRVSNEEQSIIEKFRCMDKNGKSAVICVLNHFYCYGNTEKSPPTIPEGIRVDESKLSRMDRLGLAYCRLLNYEWDDIAGPKPTGFDDLPNFHVKRRHARKLGKSKSDYIEGPIMAIEHILGEANCSRYWWRFVLGKTEDEWLHWWLDSFSSFIEAKKSNRLLRQLTKE